MRKSFKNCWLSLCLLASAALLGCGGGGGGSGSAINPSSPEYQVSNEARAARAVVSPVLQNASSILNGDVTASERLSSSNPNELTPKEINTTVISAMQAPDYLRAVICAAGGNIEGGLWENESTYSSFSEVATYANGIYERTVFFENPDDIIKNGGNSNGGSLEGSKVAYYKIEGCEADYDSKNKILKSLTIKPNAKITVDEGRGFSFDERYVKASSPTSFKGTVNTDLTVKWEGQVESFDSPKVFEPRNDFVYGTTGKDITSDYTSYNQGLQTSKKIISKTTYTFSKLEMDLTDIKTFNLNNYYFDQEFNGNLKIRINGISGSVVVNKTIFEHCELIQSDRDGWKWIKEEHPYYPSDAYEFNEETYEEILVDTSKPYYSYMNAVIVERPIMNLKYASPVTIALSGNVNNYIFGEHIWHPELGHIYYEDKKEKYNGSIKDLTLKINKMSGNLSDGFVIDDAEAHLESGDYKTDEVIRLGNQELAFNAAKIDVKGIKFNSKWLNIVDLDKKCLGNAIASLTAVETNNNVVINANCDVNAKTASLKMVNNGDYIYKENSGADRVLEFNFRTVDIDATNVDFFENNNFEGAVLEVTGVEKDDFKTTSKRTYKVVNGKLVLITADDKKIPDLPDVDISDVPEELSDSNSIEEAVSEGKPAKEIPMKDSEESLKVGSKGDLKVAHYEKKPKNGKEIKTDISAKKSNNKSFIAAVSFYGNNEFTIVFIIDYTDKTQPQIKGSIFSGARKNVTIDTEDNRLAQFSGKGDKIKVILSRGGYSEVPLL